MTTATPTYGRPWAPQGARLKEARKVRLNGLGVEKAAARYGISWRHLIRVENGERKPSAELVARIAEVTGDETLAGLYDDPDEEDESLPFDALMRRLVRALTFAESEMARKGIA